jgi:uncharacterized protein (DUF2252 family)
MTLLGRMCGSARDEGLSIKSVRARTTVGGCVRGAANAYLYPFKSGQPQQGRRNSFMVSIPGTRVPSGSASRIRRSVRSVKAYCATSSPYHC